ncbi:GPR154 [Mytilus edulis]|uniref:NPSR1 n=1 Tax=Mytilus edulis TaxID=6550 RepID=A0A8S3QNX2_MYTED|nr:GPR154 [Mytilus edulis]
MDANSTTVSTESFMDCGNDSDFILGNHTCSNNSYTDYNTDISSLYSSLKWIALCLLIGILSMNIIVISLLFASKRKSRMGFFVKNLAFSDLAVGLFFLLPETTFNWFEYEWTKYICYMYYGYFSMVAYYASTFSIVVLSVDRLYVIMRPVSTVSNGRVYRYGLALSAWIMALILGIHYAVYIKFYEDDGTCGHEFEYPKVILYFDVLVMLVLPIFTITICYILIFVTISRRHRGGFVVSKRKHNSTNESEGEIQGKDKIITTAKIKTIKLLFVVVITYILCWAPITVAAFLNHYDVISVSDNATENVVFQVLYLFAPLNSLVNPMIFLLFNRKMFVRKRKVLYDYSSRRTSIPMISLGASRTSLYNSKTNSGVDVCTFRT